MGSCYKGAVEGSCLKALEALFAFERRNPQEGE
jgi:hypothetical protein